MSWRAYIHFKNDEEIVGEPQADHADAIRDLHELIKLADASKEGFDPQDVAFMQVEPLDE